MDEAEWTAERQMKKVSVCSNFLFKFLVFFCAHKKGATNNFCPPWTLLKHLNKQKFLATLCRLGNYWAFCGRRMLIFLSPNQKKNTNQKVQSFPRFVLRFFLFFFSFSFSSQRIITLIITSLKKIVQVIVTVSLSSGSLLP